MNPAVPASRSIALRLTLTLVSVTTLLMVAVGLVSFRKVRALLDADLRRDQVNHAEQLGVALALPAWNFDREQIERIMEGALRNDNVEQVTVRLVDRNATVLTKTRARRTGGGTEPAATFQQIGSVVAAGEIIGTVELRVTTGLMEQNALRYLVWITLVGVAIDGLLVAALYALLWKTVLRPLREMEAFARSRPEPGGERLTLSDRRYAGELESLRASLERMVALLEQRHDELRQTTARLEAERSKLQALFGILPTGISITDENRKIQEMNPALERILGLSALELAQGGHTLRTYLDAAGEPLRAENLPSFRAVREQRPILDTEIVMIKEDGTQTWLSVSAAPLAGYGAAVATVDITQHKLTAQHLQAQLVELQRWQKVTLDREGRVRELKAEVNALCARAGLASRYPSQLPPGATAAAPSSAVP